VVDILVVDDHRVFAEALALRLATEPDVEGVRVAEDLASARAELARLQDGLVLLDYHLGDACGLALMDDIDRLAVRPTVVVVSGSDDVDAIVAGLRAGVDAWMLKSDAYGVLLEVSLAARDHVLTIPHRSLSEVVRRLVSAHRDVPADTTFLDQLTPRELDVLRLLVSGLRRDQVAARLYVSPNTVRTHVQHLLQRAGVHSTVALVARAREAGLTG
jgi:DNA-binding NarL/FixJ family response regulator